MRETPLFRRTLLPLAAGLILSATLAGCAPKSPELARVGKTSITTDDFLEIARANGAQYVGPPDSAKAALLDDMIKRELLVGVGRELKVLGAEEQKRMYDQAVEQGAMRTLFEGVVPRDIEVADAEVQALYQQREQETHARVVYTPDRPAIETALAEIRRGADFAAVADRFNTTGMTPPGGDLGFKVAGDLRPPLDSVIVHGPVGSVAGPIEAPGDGFFLIQLVERRARKQEPFEQVKEALRQTIRGGKQRTLMSRWQKELQAQYGIRLEPGAGQILFARYNAPKDTVVSNGTRIPVPSKPTAQEAARVLVRFKGPGGADSTYTLGDAVRDLQDPDRVKPPFTMLPMIEAWLNDAVLQRALRMEVQRRHLREDPKIVSRARHQVDNALLQGAFERVVATSAAVTRADTLASYQRHAAQLVDKDGQPMAFESLPLPILQALGNEAIEVARDRRLTAVTDSLRAQLKPVIHRDRLSRIPWPVPPAPTGK
jgi:hypothetical protein